jgi:hypothetical protein
MSNQLIERCGRIHFWGKMTHSLGLENKCAVPSLKMYIVLCQVVLTPEEAEGRRINFL